MSFCLVRCRSVSTLDLSSSKSSEDHLYPAWAYFPNLWFTLRVTVPHCAHSLSPDSSIHYAMNVPLNQRRVWPVFVVFPSGLNQVLVDEIWVVVGGIAVKLDFGIPACVSSPIWCAICSFMLAMVVIAFASSSSFDAGWCYKCCSLGLACLVLTDMSSLHFLHWFDCLIVSASVWNSNTCFFCCWTCCKESASLAWSGDWSVRAWFIVWYLLLLLPLPLNCCLQCCLFLSLGDHLLAWHYHLGHSLWCICSPLFLVENRSYSRA